MTRQRRSFDASFKVQVVPMINEQGLSLSNISQKATRNSPLAGPVHRYKVRRLMRQASLKPVWKRKFVHTTASKHDVPTAPNILALQFNPTAPNVK